MPGVHRRLGLVAALAAMLLSSLTFVRPTAAAVDEWQQPSHQTNDGPFFMVKCPTTYTSQDDPIVFPGQNNATHMHLFFGNRTVNENSTYTSMIGGATSCELDADTAGYWIPSLYDADSDEHRPKRVRAYYFANSDDKDDLHPHPANLRLLAGSASATGAPALGVAEFQCRKKSDQNGTRDIYDDYTDAGGYPQCRSSEYLSLAIRFPDCLAVNALGGPILDSADHRSHARYSDRTTRCPSSHPYKIPKLRLSFTYENDGGYSGGRFTFGAPAGQARALQWYQIHADLFQTWQQDDYESLVRGCLQQNRDTGGVNCQ